MSYKIISKAIVILAMLTACTTNNPAPITGLPPHRTMERPHRTNETEADTTHDTNHHPIPFTVLHKQPATHRGLYEPNNGVYLGAWLRQETTFRAFETAVGKRHAVFVNELFLGEDLPVTWLLQCIAAQATPLFIIHAPDDEITEIETEYNNVFNTDYFLEEYSISPEEHIVELAKRMGAFNLPMFVAFYPPGHNLTPSEYTILFRYARAVFMAYAPLVSFVWVAPDTKTTLSNPFYPGHDSVDWVGVSLFSERDESGFKQDILDVFDPFYREFSLHKPIMILPLGISHLSSINFGYSINCASQEIKRVYNAFAASFPRVGLVVYGDAFIIDAYSSDDFSITLDRELTESYATAISCEAFLSVLDKNASAGFRGGHQWVRSAFSGYYYNNNIYVDTLTLSREINIQPPRTTKEINGRLFAEARRISGHTITYCAERMIIFIDD